MSRNTFKARLASLIAASILVGVALTRARAADMPVELITGNAPTAEQLAEIMYPAPRYRSIKIADAPVVPKAVGFIVEFDLNSSAIRPESHSYLDEIGRMLHLERVRDMHMQIEGHADASGTEQYNQWLSERRAYAVANYLVRNHEIDPDRLTIIGRGETRPLDGHEPTDPANRRVQFQAVN